MDITTKIRSLNAEAYKLNLKDRKPMMVCDRLSKLYESGMEAKQKKKYDAAYIYFKRWIGCVDWLKTQGLDKGTIQKYFPNSKVKCVKNLLQEVINSLTLELDVEKSRKYHLANPQLRANKDSSMDDDIALLLPDTPNEEPQPKENDEITCTELFKILNKNMKPSDKRLLVIDVRSKIDYGLTRISFPDKMINIPAEKIESNKAASHYACVLIDDTEAVDRFNRRSGRYTDIVVLLDWYSSLNTMKSNSPIAVLRKCLKELDGRTEYKRMAVLKGGFAEWINTYPTYVTNPSIKKPFVPKDTTSDEAGKVSNDSLPSVPTNENLKPMPTTIPTTPNLYISDVQIFPTSDIQPMDTSSDTLDKVGYSPIPSIENYTPSPVIPRTRPLGVPVKQVLPSQISIPMDINSQAVFPDFARTYEVPAPTARMPPPSFVNGYYPEMNSSNSSSIDRQLLRQKNITHDAKVIVEKLPPVRPPIDRSKKPQTSGRKNSTSSFEVQQRLEKELADVHESIIMFSNRNPNHWTREQLDTLRTKKQELVAEIEKLRKLEEVKSTKLYPLLPDVSTMSIGGKSRVARSSKSDLSEEKENIPHEAPRPKPADKPHMPPPPQKMEVVGDPDTEPEEEIRKEPLKPKKPTVTSGGLKRSHTSPDLLKVKKLKARQQDKKPVPEVDRSLKPKVVLENTNYNGYNAYYTSKDREQRLEPVYSSARYVSHFVFSFFVFFSK